jgi:hypothetical protein
MGLFQKPPKESFFLFYILILIYFFEYETIVRSSVWFFDHSDPDPSSVPTNYTTSQMLLSLSYFCGKIAFSFRHRSVLHLL